VAPPQNEDAVGAPRLQEGVLVPFRVGGLSRAPANVRVRPMRWSNGRAGSNPAARVSRPGEGLWRSGGAGLPAGRDPFEIEIQAVQARADFFDLATPGVVLLRDYRHLLIDEFHREGGVPYLSLYRHGAPDLDPIPAWPQASLDLILPLFVDPAP